MTRQALPRRATSSTALSVTPPNHPHGMMARRWTFATDGAGAMAQAAPGIVGKTIAHLVVKQWPERHPRSQLFLVFTDGTYYEFYTYNGELTGASAIDRGGLAEARRYLGEEGIVLQASRPETMEGDPAPLRDADVDSRPHPAKPEDEVWEEAILRALKRYNRQRREPGPGPAPPDAPTP